MTGVSSRTVWLSATALTAVLLLAMAPRAAALSCVTQTMEQSYKQSEAVFLARIISAELIIAGDEAPFHSGTPAGIRHHFQLVEVFKGEIKYDSFESDLQWGTGLAHFAIGEINLFFMSEQPGFDSCTPRYLLGQPDTAFVLDKLRSLKDGLVDSISGSWVTNTSARRCSMYTTYLLDDINGSLSVSVGHTKATDTRAARSAVWMYSQSKRDSGVISDEGLTMTFGDRRLVVPLSSQPTAQTANFYEHMDDLADFLSAVLNGGVQLEGVTRSDQPVKIEMLLNGGTRAVERFAQCSQVKLTAAVQP